MAYCWFEAKLKIVIVVQPQLPISTWTKDTFEYEIQNMAKTGIGLFDL